MFDAMAKFPSDFPLHIVFGQSMAGGVVPVKGGFVLWPVTMIMKKRF